MMKAFVKTALLGSLLFLGAQGAKAQVSVGIEIGAPPPPHVLAVRPVTPGPDFLWVDGYWYPVNGHYHWHAGYWTRPPYAGAHWVAPHHDGHSYYAGYWMATMAVSSTTTSLTTIVIVTTATITTNPLGSADRIPAAAGKTARRSNSPSERLASQLT